MINFLKMNTSVFYIPEVLEKILLYLDGKSLLNCQKVSNLFLNVINTLSKKTQIWKWCCEEDIPAAALTDFTNNLHYVNYRLVYLAWQRWNTLSSLVISKNEVNILPDFGNITTLKTSGSTIITGHQSGEIAMWNFDATLRSSLHWGPQQGQINVMEVMCLSVLSPRSKLKHDYLLFSSNNLLQIAYLKEYAIISLGTICIHATQIETLSVYNKYVAVLSEDQFSLWCVHRNYSPEDIKAEQGGIVKNQQATILATVSLWGGVVSALSATMNFCVLSSATKKFQREVLPEGDAFESASIVRAYLWQNNVSVSLTADHYMYIYIRNKSIVKYNTMPAFNSYPMSTLLHGTTFIVGTENGQLHLFSLQQIEDLLCLNINKPSQSLKVSDNAIAEININETLLGPIITVCSSKKVYCIELSKELREYVKE